MATLLVSSLLALPATVSAALPPSRVTLEGPTAVRPGEAITYVGRYDAAWNLHATIELYRLGVRLGSTTTSIDGSYSISVKFPAIAGDGDLVAWARPVGARTQLDARSPALPVHVAARPGVPQDLSAVPVEGGLIVDLRWAEGWYDPPAVPDGYRVDRKLLTGNWTTIATVSGEARTYRDTAPVASEPSYRVTALAGTQASGPTAPVQVVPAAPLEPQNVKATGIAWGSLISWDEPAPGGGIAQAYRVIRRGEGQPPVVIGIVPGSIRQLGDRYPALGLHEYRVESVNLGPGSAGANTTILLGKTTPPTELTSYNSSLPYVELAWGPPVHLGNGTLVAYHVYRDLGAGEEHLAELTSSSRYVDASLSWGQEATYRIVARNERGQGESAFIRATAADDTELRTYVSNIRVCGIRFGASSRTCEDHPAEEELSYAYDPGQIISMTVHLVGTLRQNGAWMTEATIGGSTTWSIGWYEPNDCIPGTTSAWQRTTDARGGFELDIVTLDYRSPASPEKCILRVSSTQAANGLSDPATGFFRFRTACHSPYVC